jgi:arginine/lysine/histidine/glutamine transport system substrate-binding/permease protein
MVRFDFSRLCVLIVLICGLLAGCSGNSRGNYILRVATEPAFPPFEFQSKGGELEGFSIDLIRAIATAANFRVEFQSLPFDGIIPALQAKTIDGAISSITITPERAKTVAFSRPYFKAGLAIAIRVDNQNITGFDSLQKKKLLFKLGQPAHKRLKV